MKRILLLALLSLSIIGKSISQNVFDPADAIVRYSSSAAYGSAQRPDTTLPGLQKYVSVSTNGISSGTGSFDASSFKSYFIRYFNTTLAFRLKFPKSYGNPDSLGKKYPMMLFMHGAGEVACASNGGIYNNEKQLTIGGQVFRDAVDAGKFDGFLIYPELRSPDNSCWGEWGSSQSAQENTVITFIDSLIKYARADIDRLFVDGLSGGGVATWRMAEYFPTRVAEIAPTSAAGLLMNYAAFVHIPIWLATGGKDTNPSPVMALYSENQVSSIGGSIRRSLYADLGHASWYAHWGEADFIPYMNQMHKANPLIFFNRFEFCPDSAVSTKLGITPGFYAYEWQKDSQTIATRTNTTNTIVNGTSIISYTGNEITVKAFGSYRVRFKRTAAGDWSIWSPRPAVIKPKTITQTPPITVVGLKSSVLPSLDGKTSVQLQMPAGYLNYQWYRTTDNSLVSTNQIYDAPVGSYKARYSEPYGCGTLFSPIFSVVASSGTPKPDPAKNLAITTVSQTGLRLDWSDNPNATLNETGFEVYRAVKAGGPYSLLKLTAPNVVTFTDTTLIPNSKYYYVVRSVAGTGAAANSNEASGVTQVDNKAPTAPVNLEYRGSNVGTVFLRWGAATDDVGLARYDIYVNGVKTYSTPDLSFPVANLDSLTSYTFVVKAVDKAGNVSPSSNQVLGFTHHQGLNYRYFQGTFNTLPNFNNIGDPVKSGITDTVNAGDGIRTQDDNYAFIWEGRIYIPISGYYTFETNSDDGSKMYLDMPYAVGATAFINNDGAHGATTVTATRYLAQGYHTVAYTFSEIGGDQVMDIYWSSTSTGLARERVPKNFLATDDYSGLASVVSPSSLVATPVAYNKIKLRWTDNSADETGFEIVRSTSMTGTFTPVFTVGANVTSYNDSGLVAGTNYFYKVRAINANGASPYEFAFNESNWDFNNTYADSTGVSANALSGTSATFSSSDKVEGTHSVSIANNGYLSFNTGSGGFPAAGGYNQRTVSLWIKSSTLTGKRMIFDFGGADNGLGLRFNSNDLIAGIASGSVRYAITLNNFASNTNWKSGQWNHVAVVYDVATLTLYLNGVSVATNPTAFSFISVANSTNASRIGNYTGSNVFNDATYSTFVGLIDNMYVIRAALSKSEIDSLRLFTYGPSSAATSVAPVKPSAPSALTAEALSGDSIQLKWTDNSSNETGFEIFRSSGNKSNNRLIATVPAGNGGQITFLDSALFANVTYYYRVRATGVTAPSDSSAEASATTLNTRPVMKKIRDFTMKYGTTFILPVNASDVDGDILTFTTLNLPAFGVLSAVENGSSKISFSPGIANRKTYRMSIYVGDGNGGKDTTTFTLTVNSNDVPVLTPGKDTVINEGGSFILPLAATDNNGTGGMIWSFDGLPSFATFTNNNDGTGVLKFNPDYSASGTYQVTITLNDGLGAWTTSIVNLTVVDKEPNETVQFDFRSTSSPVTGWNNVNVVSPGFSHSVVSDIKGNVSSIALSLVKGSVSPTTSGWTTGGNTGVYPDMVLRDAMIWGFNGTTNVNDTIQVKVTGLDPSKTYNFMFHSGYNINAVTIFKIGTASVSRNGYQNTAIVDTLKNVLPANNGEVVITMIGDPSTTRGGILNAMVIRANYEDGSTPAKPASLAATQSPTSGISLTWLDKAYNESAYYVYRANVQAGPYTLLNNGATNKDSTSFNDPNIAPQTTYYYYVVGMNAAGTGVSSDSIKVVTGNNAPIITAPAGVYVKAESAGFSDFTATDDPGDVVTVSISNQPSFVSLQSLGGSNYRINATPTTDNIGWYSLVIKATDDKGTSTTKTINVGVTDKNTRSVFINFGSTTVANAPWNNWLGAKASGAAITALKDETNTATTIAVTNTIAWGGLNDLGHVTGNNSGVYPDSVLASGLLDATGPKTFTITGLNNAMKYNVVFVGSMNEGGNNTVEYSSGTTKDTLNSKYNTNQTANVNGLTPNSGSISVTATRILGTSYLNAMVIEEYDPNVVTILNPLNLYAEPVDRNNVDLSWSDRTVDEDIFSGYILDRASDSLFIQNVVSVSLPANTSTYRYSGLTANTKYWFRIRARNSGGAFSDYSNRAKAITPASIVYVNFNYTMPNAPAPWNNTYSAPSFEGTTFTNLTNQSGIISGLSLVLTRIFNGEFTAGMTTGNNSGPVPDAVIASDYWQDNTQLSQFKVTGLNQSRRYRVGFIGSSSPNGWFKGNYTGTYTVNGRTVYLNSWLNSSKIVYIGDIVPSDDGSMQLDFSTTVAAQYSFNAGIIIEDYSDPIGGSQSNLVLSNPSLLASAMGQDPAANQQIAAAAASSKTKMYPNPFVDFINMDFNNTSANNNISLDVYDLSGRTSYHRSYGKLPAGNNTLSLNGNDAGMITGVYIITLNVNGKPVQTNKVIRTKK
jgi:hypothetical protein